MHIGILVASLLLLASLTGCGGSDSGGNGGDSASLADRATEQAPDQESTFTVTLFASDGGNLSFSGNQEVTAGSVLSATVTPDTGYRIESVDGCGGVLEDYTFTTEPINGDCTVEATFTLLSYEVTPNAGVGGSIAPETIQIVDHGGSISFTILPDVGYQINSVSGCDGSLEDDEFTVEAITQDCSVDVTFSLVNQSDFTVTPSAGPGGQISPGSPQVVNSGSSTSFTVEPDLGYEVAAVTGCGGSLDGTTYTTGVVNDDCSVEATFSLLSYEVTPIAGGGGSFTPTGIQTVNHGDTLSFSVTSDSGYEIETVTGCGGSLDGTTYTAGEITGACSLEATFSLLSYDVTPIAGEGGILTPEGIQTVNHGDTLSFSVTPDSGYEIETVTGCDGSLDGTTYTTGEITDDCAVEASFSASSVEIMELNDTGIVTCSNYDAEDEAQWTSGLSCASTGATQSSDGIDSNGNIVPAAQDAHYGRDAQALDGALGKTGSGNAGFDFTKLDASGNALPESAESWSCVRDNVTGLIWEVKTNDGGLHDANDRYNWFNPDAAVNGGSEGFADDDGAICSGYDSNDSDTYCNTLAFTTRVNEQGLCGLSNWRLPSKKELRSIIDYQQYSPSIDTQYFPNTLGDNWFWSSSPYAAVIGNVWVVNFNIGIDGDLNRNGAYYVRLVHSDM